MKKVAIITIESFNYGNRLQNYALQEVLKEMGFSVETLHRERPKNDFKSYLKRAIQIVLQSKAAKFRNFDKNIAFANIVLGRDVYPENLGQQYDWFIAGSDQIWNPYYEFAAGECDFLSFAPPEKRIAYAPSFGVSEVPDDKKSFFAMHLSTFAHLSCREQQGAEIIRNLTGRQADVVLDPTMLLKREQWEKMAKKSRYVPSRKYVFVYILGEISNEMNTVIDYYKSRYCIFDIRRKGRNGHEIPLGPAEFLYGILHAEIVLTDSFHCTVFSFIFNRKVYPFSRSGVSINSRITTLYESLGAEKSDFHDIKMDFSRINQNLEEQRKQSLGFLRNALQV